MWRFKLGDMWFRKNKNAPAANLIDSTLLVDEVMRTWPQTIRVFLGHGMKCVGCPIGVFHTVEDACAEHHVDSQGFVAALEEAATLPRTAAHSDEDSAIK